MTPNDALANRGAHLVPNKKSLIGTCRKNSTAGTISATTIPIVITIVSHAASRNTTFATASPGRRTDVVNDGRRLGDCGPTPRSVGARDPALGWVAVRLSMIVRRR
jgi:hypothetical protein